MDVLQVDLDRIAREIWCAVLGLELTPNTNELDVHSPDERVVTGCVLITGDWEGAVTVQAPERFAAMAAGLMFMMEPDQVADDEITDTVGELANMAGGNVKSVLPGSCQLSLPSVTSGRDYHVSIPGATTRERLALECEGELIVVSLLQRQLATG